MMLIGSKQGEKRCFDVWVVAWGKNYLSLPPIFVFFAFFKLKHTFFDGKYFFFFIQYNIGIGTIACT